MHHPQPESAPSARRLTRNLRLVAALAAAGLFFPAISFAADPAPAAAPPSASAEKQTGVVQGRVFNTGTGTYLPNARVRVAGTTLEAFTDDGGYYQLRNVPAGEATLTVSFTGQNDLSSTVRVDGAAPTVADFTFNAAKPNAEPSTIVLDKFAVEAQRFRNAVELATNEERTATNIKSVVAVDSLGYMVDGNIGDFVRYQAGVDVEFGSSSGNANNPDNAMTVGVRGFGADSTAILIDGMPIASGSVSGNGSLTRAVMLDGLSINNASRLEIIKVATPDMPQDSPGGAINLITRGAFELSKVRYDISLAFNGNTNTPSPLKKTPGPYAPSFKTLPSARFSATIPFSNKLGVTFSVASDNKYSLTRNSNLRDWFTSNRTVTINGVVTQVANAKGGIRIDNPALDRMELVDNQWVDNRYSGNVRVDWRPVPELEIRANAQFSTFENTGVYRRTQWRYTNATSILDWGPDFVTGRQRTPTFTVPAYSVGMTTDARDKRGFTSSGYITAKYEKGPWSFYAKASASESYSDLPDLKNGHFSTIDSSLTAGRIDLVNINKGLVGEIKVWDVNANPVDYGKYTAWTPSLTPRSSQVQARDTEKQFNLDVARELDFLPFPTTVKVGAMEKIKSNRKAGLGTSYRKQYIGPAAEQPTAASLQSEFATEAIYGYATPQHWTDNAKYYDFFVAHPEWFNDQYIDPVSNLNLPANNYLSFVGNSRGLTTTTDDYYAMITSRFFSNRLTVIAGGRQSRKHNKGYTVYIDPKFNYIRNADGTLYRDSVYPVGIRFDGANNAAGVPRDIILTDTALRARLAAAGVPFIPSKLELAPNGTANGTESNNLFLAMRRRYTRYIDTKLTEPVTPQIQLAYEITDTLRAQVAWSKETRLPEIEAANGIVSGGGSFQVTENDFPTPDPGGDGTILITNIQGKPEINQSYNFRIGYYPKNGLGRYSISYYHKVVDNAWQTIDTFNTDSDYGTLLESMGLSPNEFRNYVIRTTLPTDLKQTRKGFEVEASQNLGIISPRAKGVDVFVTYTRRPVTASIGGEARLGWISIVPVRAKWTGGVSYSMRRFSIQAKFTWEESGITYQSNPSVTMPDGTTAVVQYYNLNKRPVDINVQANYVFNKHFTFFATANRVGAPRIFNQISDAITGYQPDYASYRSMQDRGVAVALGVNASF